MSTLRVNNLQNTSTTDGGISIDNSGHITMDNVAYPSAGPLSNRNLIINGAMQVAQRGTQVTGVTTVGYRTVDRFIAGFDSLGTWTIDQSTDSPNGFSNSLKITNTTADASPAANDYALVEHKIEAQNLQGLGYGSADAKPLTLSFWVKSNKTGSASVELRQLDNSNKLFSATYSISSADTWEHKTVSIPADTAGVINNDNGIGLSIIWWLNSGSTYTGGSAASTWSTYDGTRRNVSNLGVGGATSDYFAITGVQLEVGEVATPFEHRSYGDELLRCQRYYFRRSNDTGNYVWLCQLSAYDSGGCFGLLTTFPVEMRATPTTSASAATDFYPWDIGTPAADFTSVNTNRPTRYSMGTGGWTGSSGLTPGDVAVISMEDGGYIDANAEL